VSSDLLAFLKWYLAVSAAGLLALPLAFRFFRRLPDRGYPLARMVGLLGVGWSFWLLGSLGFLRNDVPGLLFASALVGGLGVWWLGRTGLTEVRDWLREQLTFVVAVEVLFLAAFALMAYVRAYNPNIQGTEKPMEFMFINAIMRSPAFPPNDAWLSGHAISYYYFGYVMVASLARLTGTATSMAFNLGLALLFALTAAGSLSVAVNLIALAQKDEGVKAEGPDAALQPSSCEAILHPSFWPALLAPFLVLVVGNFYGLAGMVRANGLFPDLTIPAAHYYFGMNDPVHTGLSAGNPVLRPANPDQPGARFGLVNLWDWLDLKLIEDTDSLPVPPERFWDTGGNWFFAARVVHDRNLTGIETEAIDEMPAFSFILGDMHPHVLALPFVFLAMALALDWMLWGGNWKSEAGGQSSEESPSDSRSGLRTLTQIPDRLFFSALVLGGLSFLNTWDFPIYWFLTILALVIGLGLKWGWEAVWERWRTWGSLALVMAVLSVLLYLPFYFTFQSQAGGILPNLIYPTRFQQLVVFFGPTLVGVTVFLAWLSRRERRVLDRRMALWAGGGIVGLLALAALALAIMASLNDTIAAYVDSVIAPFTRAQALGLVLQRRGVDSLATFCPAALIGAAVGLGVGALRTTGEGGTRLRSPALLMTLAMALTGALLLIGPEFVYLRDNFGTRMNTIFKFYFQTWALWAMVSALGLWYMWQHARRVGRWVASGVMGLAILGGLAYTWPALYVTTGHFAGPPTLDGMAYFAQIRPDDWKAIEWLQQNVPDTAVIAEAVGGAYTFSSGTFESRISMATGLPTVMGWVNHEGQWRGEYYGRVAERPDRVQALYQARDWATANEVLETYGIDYVIVSSTERNNYRPVFTPKFDQRMRQVYPPEGETSDVVIYQRLDSQAQSR
jgi:YYY domain-containing protein